MRNDYSIWGVRKTISGAEIPVHLRYAIDTKPEYYVSFNNIMYTTKSEDEVFEKGFDSIVANLDWRELIFQMAKDYYKNNTKD
jgi:hypothetical protein